MVTFWGAIKLYFQINMTKALILNVMPDMTVVKYVNFVRSCNDLLQGVMMIGPTP